MKFPKLRDFMNWNLKYEPWNLSVSWKMGPHLKFCRQFLIVTYPSISGVYSYIKLCSEVEKLFVHMIMIVADAMKACLPATLTLYKRHKTISIPYCNSTCTYTQIPFSAHQTWTILTTKLVIVYTYPWWSDYHSVPMRQCHIFVVIKAPTDRSITTAFLTVF